MSLERAVENLLSVNKDKELITNFVLDRYEEKFLNENDFIIYNGFDILSKNEIKVKYKTGYRNFEDNSSFIINMTEYYKNENSH